MLFEHEKGRSSQYAENARVLTNDVWLETSRCKDTKLSRKGKFADVLEYADYAPDWCIIISEEAYKEHTDNGENVFYFLVRSDMQNVPRLPGKEFPKDEYGLSLMAVCVTPKGGISSITSRWNYGDDQDCFLTLSELELLVGRKIIDQMLNAVCL